MRFRIECGHHRRLQNPPPAQAFDDILVDENGEAAAGEHGDADPRWAVGAATGRTTLNPLDVSSRPGVRSGRIFDLRCRACGLSDRFSEETLADVLRRIADSNLVRVDDEGRRVVELSIVHAAVHAARNAPSPGREMSSTHFSSGGQ